jgi:hypothetical protein
MMTGNGGFLYMMVLNIYHQPASSACVDFTYLIEREVPTKDRQLIEDHKSTPEIDPNGVSSDLYRYGDSPDTRLFFDLLFTYANRLDTANPEIPLPKIGNSANTGNVPVEHFPRYTPTMPSSNIVA